MLNKQRGRPKYKLDQPDLGTPELQKKIANNDTTEPLDLCLQKGLISEQQHKSGITLRWLYTLKFGSPTVSAYDPSNLGGFYKSKYNDDEWLAKKQREYKSIMSELAQKGLPNLVCGICIHHDMPSFLIQNHRYTMIANADLAKFQDGLELIAKIITKKQAN